MDTTDFLAGLPMIPSNELLRRECLSLSQLLTLTGTLLFEKAQIEITWEAANPDDEDDCEQYPYQHEALLMPTANNWTVYYRNKPHELMIGFAVSPTNERWEHTSFGDEVLYIRPQSLERYRRLVDTLQERRRAFLWECPRVELVYDGFYLSGGAVYHESDVKTRLYQLQPDNTLSELLADPHHATAWWYPQITIYDVLSV